MVSQYHASFVSNNLSFGTGRQHFIKPIKSMKLFAYFVCLLLAITSCGGSDSGPSSEPTHAPTPAKVAVTGVTVNKESLTLMEGAAEDITATITPDNASNKSVTWKTDDPNVATVSGGKITAVGPGVTTITVTTTDGSKTATIIVTVTMDVPGRQKRALLALFEKAGGTSWTNKTGWNTDTPYKEWYGVKTSGDYVTEIDLTGNNLTGTLPDGIQNLSKLTKLILANNNLTGAIPPTWGEKTSATTKSEATTRDNNEVPKLADLKTLDLSNNQLSGEIPVALGNLTALTTLKLDHNKLSGNIPASLANLSKLTTLTIAHNELDGKIAEDILKSEMWKKLESEIDLTQDNGMNLDDGKPKNDFGYDDINDLIVFADHNVKAICVSLFDTNKDGELSYAEAAAVESIPEVERYYYNEAWRKCAYKTSPFREVDLNGNGRTIYCFNELKYFTSLKEIPEEMFCGQNSLEEVTLPSNVTKIGVSAFSGCMGLTNIEIPANVTIIEGHAFYGCTGLTSIDIPNSVTKIGSRAFKDCTGLTSIEIPNSVTYLDYGAFSGCTGLTRIEIPNSVTELIATFEYCTELTSINIPNGVTKLQGTFQGCTKLNNVVIPNSVTYLRAFGGCTGLTTIEIPNSVTILGGLSGTGLTSIKIPNSVTTIEDYAFSDCTGLTNIEIPNSVTSIERDAFSGCTGLTSIEIPKSVSTIGSYLFQKCDNLIEIRIMSEYPPTIDDFGSNVRISITTNCKIYVPAGAVERYKNNDQWKQYADQIMAMP